MSDISNNDSSDDSSDNSGDDTEYDTEDEAFAEPIPANLSPIPGQNVPPGQPIRFDINSNERQSSNLPLCLVFNSRSVYNKADNLKEMLHTIGPDISIISETFEREKKRLSSVLNSQELKYVSNFRKNRAPGGGCAIIFNENRFSVSNLEVPAPEEIESCWALFVPKSQDSGPMKVKRIAVGSYYVSPKSRHKQEVIEHIIDTIHMLRAQFANEVNFLIAGDFNRLDVTDILDSYGALKQIISVPTRNTATLEIILTDLHTLFHPPTTLPPLQVDSDKQGKDGDHDIVVLAPVSNTQYKQERKKKTVVTRPLPESKFSNFEHSLMSYPWEEAFTNKNVDEKVYIFHECLRSNLDRHFPEKTTKMSCLDKDWMSSQLKKLRRAMQREYYKKRKSRKYKKLKSKFKKLKRNTVKTFYSSFVNDLKSSNPGKWYQMARKIGAVDKMSGGDIQVESLSEFNNLDSAQKIAEHFAAVSSEYSPVDNNQLPCYLPALPLPQVKEYKVYLRLNKVNPPDRFTR